MEDPGGLSPSAQVLCVLILILSGAFFLLFETALSASRKSRLRKAEEEGKKRYKRALEAAESPDDYLGAARIWNAVFKIAAGAAAGYFAAAYETARMVFWGPQGVVITVVCVSLAVILGETLPRIAALAAPEAISAACLPPMVFFSLLCRPFNALSSSLSNLVRSVSDAKSAGITEDELRSALDEGEKSGLVESRERTMVEGVFYLGDKPVGTFMTHRSEIQRLDIHDGREEIIAAVEKTGFGGCIPVSDGDPDQISGAVFPEDIYRGLLDGLPGGLAPVMRKIRFVPETMPALKALETFKESDCDYLFVIDEYGGFAGIVSIRDLMEEIVGELSAPEQAEDPIVRQEDGTWLADGSLNIDEAVERLALPGLANDHPGYHTLAGFVLSLAGEVPRTGESFTYRGFRFRVVDMDGKRIDKVMIETPRE
jgi:putative hemolysin